MPILAPGKTGLLLATHAPNDPSAPELKAEVRVATSNLAKLGVVVPMPNRPSGPIVMEPIVEVPEVPVTVIVPVAIILAEETFPENKLFPCTENNAPGVVVPMPMLL